MLIRLLKYDLKKFLRFLSVFMILSLLFGALTRFFAQYDSLAWSVVRGICNGTAISMMFSLIINCMMRSWAMFRSSTYGDESYLTHTLPVKRETCYTAKVLTSTVGLLSGMLVIVITLFIMYWTEETKSMLKAFLEPVSEYLNVPVLGIVLFLFVILFLEFINFIQIGYCGLILGHRFNSNKILLSVLIGLGIYAVTQGLTLVCMLVIGLANAQFMQIFQSADLMSMKPETILAVACIGAGLYLLYCVAGFVLNRRFLKKGVNVD